MSLRTLGGFSIWLFLFLTAFAVCLKLLPASPLMTVTAPEGVAYATFSSDCALLATRPLVRGFGVGDNPPRFWHIPDGREQTLPLPGYTNAPGPAACALADFLPTGDLLLRRTTRYGLPWTLRIISPATGEEIFCVESKDSVGCVSPDGQKIATFAGDHAEIWDVPTRSLETKLGCGPPIAFSPDRRLLLSHAVPSVGPYAGEMELALWKIADKCELCRFSAIAQLNRTKAAFSRDGKTLVVGCLHSGSVPTVWDLENRAKRFGLPEVKSWALVENEKVLAGLGDDENKQTTLQFWDLASGEKIGRIGLGVSDPEWEGIDTDSLQVSPDGRYLALAKKTENKLRVLPSSLPRWGWLRRLWEGDTELKEVAEISVFDSATKRKVGTIEACRVELLESFYNFSPNGRMLVAFQGDGTIKVWPMPPRKPLWLAASLAALFVGVVWAVRLGYRRFRRRGASAVEDRGPLPA
jgi:hypothetical protein